MTDPVWRTYYIALLCALLALLLAAVWSLAARRSLANLVRMTALLALFLVVSWPELGGRLAYRWKCRSAGLQLAAPIDARDSGYLLAGAYAWPGGFSYFRHGVLDLVLGRVRFFEAEESPGRYTRYLIGDAQRSDCIERALYEEKLADIALPAGHCLVAQRAPVPQSRFELTGYAATEVPGEVSVRERALGADAEPAARFRWHRPPAWLGQAPHDRACPVDVEATPWHALWNLSSFVFVDAEGRVLREPDLEDLKRAQPAAATAAPQYHLIPPAGAAREWLASEGLLPAECRLPLLPPDVQLYGVRARAGGQLVKARLDTASESAAFVILDVNLPGEGVAVVAEAGDPTVWHVHTGPRTNLLAFIVRGHDGQAVEGLRAGTRLLLSTRRHNPQTNCSATELERIARQLRDAHALRPAEPVAPVPGEVVQYRIGEPMKDGQQGFHDLLPRSSFEVRDD